MAQVHYLSEARNDGSDLWRWSLTSRLELREWSGEFVVWSVRTGATYLVSTLAGETLKCLRNGPASAEDIAERVLSHIRSTSAATAGLVATFAGTIGDMQSLLGVLNELEAVGLAVSDST